MGMQYVCILAYSLNTKDQEETFISFNTCVKQTDQSLISTRRLELCSK